MKKRVKKELPLVIILVILNIIVLLFITFSVYNFFSKEKFLMSPTETCIGTNIFNCGAAQDKLTCGLTYIGFGKYCKWNSPNLKGLFCINKPCSELTVENCGLYGCNLVSSDYCAPLYSGNNPADSTRFNIVFVGVGFQDINDLQNAAKRVIDMDGLASRKVSSSGLMQIPTFMNNKNKFNFWYINRFKQFSKIDKDTIWNELYQLGWLNDCQNVLPNRIIPVFIYPGQNIPGAPYASYGRMYVTLTDCISPKSNCNPANPYPNLQDANIHEVLHTIPCLYDEYGAWGNANPDGHQPLQFTGTLSGNQIYQFFKGTYQDCLNNAPWKNYFGQDCGVSKNTIDCFSSKLPIDFLDGIDIGDRFCKLPGMKCWKEIGRFEGGAYADTNIWRSSSGGVMRNPYTGQIIGNDYISKWDQEIVQKVINKGPAVGKKWDSSSAWNYGIDCDATTTEFYP